MPKVIIYTDFDGTATGKPGNETVFTEFYQSLLQGYKRGTVQDDYKHTDMKEEKKLQKLFKNNFDKGQGNRDFLMSQDAVKFFHKMLQNNNVSINIVTKNRYEYIQALFKYQGFTDAEIGKLTILQSGKKYDDVYDHFNDKKENYDYVYILDDNKADLNDMIRAVTNTNYKGKQIAVNLAPGKFKWGDYLKDINQHLDSKASHAKEEKKQQKNYFDILRSSKYFININRGEASSFLQEHGTPGQAIIRKSSIENNFSISVKDNSNKIIHSTISVSNNGFNLQGDNFSYPSVETLIKGLNSKGDITNILTVNNYKQLRTKVKKNINQSIDTADIQHQSVKKHPFASYQKMAGLLGSNKNHIGQPSKKSIASAIKEQITGVTDTVWVKEIQGPKSPLYFISFKSDSQAKSFAAALFKVGIKSVSNPNSPKAIQYNDAYAGIYLNPQQYQKLDDILQAKEFEKPSLDQGSLKKVSVAIKSQISEVIGNVYVFPIQKKNTTDVFISFQSKDQATAFAAALKKVDITSSTKPGTAKTVQTKDGYPGIYLNEKQFKDLNKALDRGDLQKLSDDKDEDFVAKNCLIG